MSHRNPVQRHFCHGRLRRSTVLLVSLAILAQLACGKKGPPLAPFVRVPSPMADLTIQRVGDEVLVRFTLPTQNRDGTQPADLERVDIYAITVQPHIPADRTLELEEFQEDATLVTSIEVAPPLAAASASPPETSGEEPVDIRPHQGFPVAFSEAVTAAVLVPVDPWEEERRRREREEAKEKEDDGPKKPVKGPLMTPQLPGPLERRYAVVGVSSKGHESEPVARIAAPLVTPPFAPPAPVVTYDEEVATIVWELPVGVRRSVQVTATPGAALGAGPTISQAPATTPAAETLVPGVTSTVPAAEPPLETTPVDLTPAAGVPTPGPEPVPVILPPLVSTPIVEWPPASRYELFEIVEADEGPFVMPRPLNLLPLAVATYADNRVEFGVERCYAVVTVDVVSELDIRSALSEPTCLTFSDTFAPAAPTGLNAVGTDGAVSLSWQPNEEEDLAGYLVLRGVAPGETLLPLTAEPVQQSTYRDGTAEPGVRYVYAVQAVDDAVPLNVSLASETFNATAR